MMKILILIILFRSCRGVIYKLNASEYNRIPPVFYLDDYERCLQEPGGLFCTFEADLVSDTPSELLTLIKGYSLQVTTHFNHSHLHYGLCVTNTCIRQNELSPDLRYVLEGCLNVTLWDQYKLKARVADQFHCNMPNQYGDLDTLDIFVAVVLLFIVMVNLVGSLCDIFGAKNVENNKGVLHYFSIRDNWRILVASSGKRSDPRMIRLTGFHGIKTIIMLFLINAHGVLPYMTYVTNPWFIESLYSDLSNHPFINGALLTRTYFIVSAFMLTYCLQLFAEKNDINWSILQKWILLRIFRLTPTYAVVLAWSMTWARFLGDGPHWHRGAFMESEHCRRDWWKHLLYINNYFNGSHCNIPTWYLAADMQLYCLALVFLISCRSTRSRKLGFALLFIIGLIIPALHIYFEDLFPFPLSSPTNVLNFFTTDRTFNIIYKRGHTNILSCGFGIALGLIVYHCQKNNFDVNKYKRYRIIFWALPAVCAALVTSGCIFFADGPEVSVVTRLLFSVIAMPLLSFVLCVFFWGVIMKFEDVYRGILEWRGWVTPARLSYGAFLVHGTLIRLMASSETVLTHASLSNCFKNGLFIIVLAYSVAFPLFMMVESPFKRLLEDRGMCRKYSVGKRKKSLDKKND